MHKRRTVPSNSVVSTVPAMPVLRLVLLVVFLEPPVLTSEELGDLGADDVLKAFPLLSTDQSAACHFFWIASKEHGMK